MNPFLNLKLMMGDFFFNIKCIELCALDFKSRCVNIGSAKRVVPQKSITQIHAGQDHVRHPIAWLEQ